MRPAPTSEADDARARAAIDEAPERRRVGRSTADRDEPDRRDVHPEAGAGRGDEGDLDGDRDEPEAARRQ